MNKNLPYEFRPNWKDDSFKHTKIPDDSAMSDSVKALFTGVTQLAARPRALHIPHYDDETLSLCSKMKIKKKDNPSKYGPFCGGCKRKYYTDGRN